LPYQNTLDISHPEFGIAIENLGVVLKIWIVVTMHIWLVWTLCIGRDIECCAMNNSMREHKKSNLLIVLSLGVYVFFVRHERLTLHHFVSCVV